MFMLRSRICRLHFETEKVLGTDLLRHCDMNDVTIPHALCIEKNIVFYIINFREGWYGFRKPQCGDPEHLITLCEINSIKTDNIGGYIPVINLFTHIFYFRTSYPNGCFGHDRKALSGLWNRDSSWKLLPIWFSKETRNRLTKSGSKK